MDTYIISECSGRLILMGLIGGIGSFRTLVQNGMTHFRREPFTQRLVSSGQKTKSVRFIDWSL